MKSTDLKTNTSYGIVPSWSYSTRTSRDPLMCTRDAVVQATLLSLEKYRYEVMRTTDEFAIGFRETTDTKRFGYKVTDGKQFWIARPQDIVAVWVSLEARWSAEEAMIRIAEEKRERERKIEEEMYAEAVNYSTEARERITMLIRGITHKEPNVSISIPRRNNSSEPFTSTVTLNLRVMDALIEKVMEAIA